MTNSTIELLIKNIKYFRTQKNFIQEKLSEIKRLIKIAEALDIDIYKFFMVN